MKLTPSTVLLRTPTGSRLYGTHGPDSDYDEWEVVLGPSRPKQRTDGSTDLTRMDLATFTDLVGRGVPQALEALWSPRATIHPAFAPYFAALRPDLWQARMRHLATHRNKQAGNKGPGHAVRTARNFEQLLRFGRYSPVASAAEKAEIRAARAGTLDHLLVQRQVAELLPPES